MRERDGGVCSGEQPCHRPADDRRSADHDGTRAGKCCTGSGEELHHRARGAGGQHVLTVGEAAGIDGMEAVHVLCRVDRLEDGAAFDMRRQRKLDQYAVHVRVRIQRGDNPKQGSLGGFGGQADGVRIQAGFAGGAVLCAYVDGAGRVVAYQHHGQFRAIGELGGVCGDFGPQGGSQCTAVQDTCGHGLP